MGQRKSFDLSEAGRRLALWANWVVRIFGGAIFLFLTWYSMRYTQYINPGWNEKPVNVPDSMLQNIAVLLAAVLLFCGLLLAEKRLQPKMQKTVSYSALTLVILWVGIWGFWWISSAERIPEGDQAFVYGGASYFLEGNFAFLDKGCYCSIYPHQLALIALTELLFLLVGTYNYFAFQCICVLLAMAIVYIGFQIVRCITDRMSAMLFYCISMLCCVPLVLYTSWVYGEIPSIFFTMLAAWMFLLYERKGHWGYLAAVAGALTFAMLVRKNSLLVVIAFCIIAAVRVVLKKDKKLFAAAVLTAVLPGLLYAGVYKMYEIRSGFVHEKGLPVSTWVAMGMQETDGKFGWYNNYGKELLHNAEGDYVVVDAIAKQEIKDRIRLFLKNPSYAWNFFREKILSQWNMPLYESMFFNTKYQEGHIPIANSFVMKISTLYFTDILRICDRLQFVLYFGMLLYFVFAVKPESNLSEHLMAVAVIGGFLFSIIWEAKARYVLPYYITMFPLAAAGYWRMLQQAALLFRKEDKETRDNIVDFHRAA